MLHCAVSSDRLEIIKYLVEKGANINGMRTDGCTVLHSAITKGTLEIVKYLVEKGADVNGKITDGSTVLHSAVTKHRLEIVKYLVEKGADVDSEDTKDITVLHAAVNTDDPEIIKYCVEQVADITFRNKVDSHTLATIILKIAVLQISVDLVNLLLKKNITSWQRDTFFVDGRNMSLLELSIHLGHNWREIFFLIL